MTSEIPTTLLASDQLGSLIGDGVSNLMSSGLDEAMKGVWEAATWFLSTAFSVADSFSTFTVDPQKGSLAAVWPTLLAISTTIALGLFFWQLTLAGLRGGRGMMRVATGPVAYGIALGITVGVITTILATADGLTSFILSRGLGAANFSAAFTHTSLGGAAAGGVKAVALGLVGFFGLIPAAIGWVLEIIWRQAAILALVAAIPITAAGLLAQTTASWFWRGLRWTLAAIAVKPVLALMVVLGVSALAGADGPVGLLAGVGVLWVSLSAPMALFRLLAFVDPNTDAGATLRDSWQQLGSRISAGSGARDYEGFETAPAGGGGSRGGSGDGGIGALESANAARFDAACADSPPPPTFGNDADQDTTPPPPTDTGSGPNRSGRGSTPGTAGGWSGEGGGDEPPPPVDPPPAPQPPDLGGPGPGGGSGPHPPTGPSGGPGGGGGGAGGGAAGSAATEAAEAAVII